jgi:DnaD/phage-associated family protein
MSDYKYMWIKLYTEILHDPKMAKLDDHLWRRAIEIFLLAGENSMEGTLPSTEDMAWVLRTDEESLVSELLQLAKKIGVEFDAELDAWVVSNFSKRQAALSSTERMRKLRGSNELIASKPSHHRNNANDESVTEDVTKTSQERHRDGDESVTEENRKEKNRIEKKRIEVEQNKKTATTAKTNFVTEGVWELYQNNFGQMTPLIEGTLAVLEKKYTTAWVEMALNESLKSNVRNLKYVEAILSRWAVDGLSNKREPARQAGKNKTRSEDVHNSLAEWVAEANNG